MRAGKRLNIIFFFGVIIPLSTLAQPRFDFAAIKKQIPGEDVIFLTNKASLVLTFKNDKLDISERTTDEILFLNEKASLFANKSIYYYDETENISDIDAASYVPQENGRLKKMQVEKTYTDKPRKGDIFYDDLNEIYFNFPSLKEGAVSSLSYTLKYKDPHFIDPFFFGNNAPTRDAEYSVTFPREVKIGYILKGDTAAIQFSKTETRTSITYTWKTHDLPSYGDLHDEGNWRRYIPHVILYVNSYTAGGKEEQVLGDPKQLHHWYYTHISELVNAKSDAIQQLSDSLTKGITDEKQKIKSIYYWVQDNIKYIAFEGGLGGFVPRQAALICSRRFGDCKDKSSLLYALLKAAGIRSYFTWIGTRDIPYSYHEVPTPIVDNHMIVSVYEGNHWTFLDGTAVGLPYGYPSDFIQGKEALISIGPDSFAIVKVPPVEKEKSFRTDSLHIHIDGTDLAGHGTSIYAGLWKTDLVGSFSNVAANKKDEASKEYFEYGNNKCKIDSVTDHGLDDYTDSLTFNYTLLIPGYVRKVDKKLYLNMHLRKTWQGDLVEIEKRKSEIKYRYKYLVRQISILDIPATYSISKLPEASNYKGNHYGYEISYHSGKGFVMMEKTIWFDELEKDKSEFEDWNKMINSLDDSYGQVLVLEQKN